MASRGPWRLLGLLAGAAGLVAGTIFITRQFDDSRLPPASIPVDAWVPYWALDEASTSLAANAPLLREVSPLVYSATSATEVGLHQNVEPSDVERFLSEARRLRVPVVGSISDDMPAGGMAGVLGDPVQRAAHIDAIAALAEENGMSGIDLDYEAFAFKDDSSTWDTTRPKWVTFVKELGTRLRSEGRRLVVTVPPLPRYSVYAYDEIEPHVDRIRVMAYDYSVSEPGPIAPLFFVEESIDAARAAVDDDSKIVLGVPLYGRNWLVGTEGVCPADAPGEVEAIRHDNIDDLVARRNAVPERSEQTGESSFAYSLELSDGTTTCTQRRVVHYVDPQGTAQRADLARRSFLGGASLWALGFDSPATWQQLRSIAAQPFGSPATSTTVER